MVPSSVDERSQNRSSHDDLRHKLVCRRYGTTQPTSTDLLVKPVQIGHSTFGLSRMAVPREVVERSWIKGLRAQTPESTLIEPKRVSSEVTNTLSAGDGIAAHRHLSLPQSSSSSRLTAGAAELSTQARE